MHPLAMLVLVGFCLVIALFFALWLTLQAFRPRPEPEPEPDSIRRTPLPDVSNDAVRGAKAPRKHAPIDAYAAHPTAPTAPGRAEPPVRAAGEPARSERRAGGEDHDRPDAWRTRSGGAPAAPSWRARTRSQATAPSEPPSEPPGEPAVSDTDEPRFGRASRWSWPGGASGVQDRGDGLSDGRSDDRSDGSDSRADSRAEPPPEGEPSHGNVRVRDRSDDRRRRDEEAFERFLDPKRRDDF